MLSITEVSSCCFQVRDLDFFTEIIGSEMVGEVDGLAMSARNVDQSRDERLVYGASQCTFLPTINHCRQNFLYLRRNQKLSK